MLNAGNACKADSPRKIGQIETSINDLRNATETAHKAICSLRDRLGPVLNQSTDKEGPVPPHPVLVGLAADISAQTDAVNTVRSLIEATISELEL